MPDRPAISVNCSAVSSRSNAEGSHSGNAVNPSRSSKPYDLNERTFLFARDVRVFVRLLPRTITNTEDIKQLARSSGSVGANYIEANDSLGHKDSRMRLRISRKEARESMYWLRLVDTGQSPELAQMRDDLVQEAGELVKILSAMVQKVDRPPPPP